MTNARAIVLALAILCSPAAARAETMSGMSMHGAAGHTPADKAFTASMKSMMTNMAVKPSGNPDKDFVAMMLPHHQGAVDMAKVELQYGKDPLLLKLAADIVKAQESEIALMKAWQDQSAK